MTSEDIGISERDRFSTLAATTVIFFAAISLGLVFCSILFFPRWIAAWDLGKRSTTLTADQLATIQNNIRVTLLQAIGGIVLVAGAIATWRQLRLSRMQLALAQRQALESRRNSDEQLEISREQIRQVQAAAHEELSLNREAQITERFTRAIDQLGSTSLDVRLGGIYGLRRIARDSPTEQEAVCDILAAYIRQHSPWPPIRQGQSAENTPIDEIPDLKIRSADVQAALSGLGEGLPSEHAVDLSDVDLRKAGLACAQLQCALFSSAHMESADLTDARLEQANFLSTDLSDAIMNGADLEKTSFSHVSLKNATFSGANLDSSELDEVDLRGTDFGEARGLNRAKINSARIDDTTIFPEDYNVTESYGY